MACSSKLCRKTGSNRCTTRQEVKVKPALLHQSPEIRSLCTQPHLSRSACRRNTVMLLSFLNSSTAFFLLVDAWSSETNLILLFCKARMTTVCQGPGSSISRATYCL